MDKVILPRRKPSLEVSSLDLCSFLSQTPSVAMAKRLIPCLGRILVEKIVPPSKTTVGILLSEETSKMNSGKIVVVGPGSRDRDGKLIPVSLKEGDTVLLLEYGGTEVKLTRKWLFSKTELQNMNPCVLNAA